VRKLLILLNIFLVSCDLPTFDIDNPYDPQNIDYVDPSVTILSGPVEDEIATNDQVVFNWVGNNETMTFRYFFDGSLIQEWDDITSAKIEYLDEGEHRFGVQGKYPTDDVSDTVYVNFNVNAVPGPSLLFYPRKIDVTIGQEASFKILAEEVIGLAAAEFSLSYDPLFLNIKSITQGELFQAANQSIFHVDHDPSLGTISILTAILDGKSPSVEGTGVLAEIILEVNNQGSSNISFIGVNKFRGANNTAIDISEKIGGLIIAK